MQWRDATVSLVASRLCNLFHNIKYNNLHITFRLSCVQYQREGRFFIIFILSPYEFERGLLIALLCSDTHHSFSGYILGRRNLTKIETSTGSESFQIDVVIFSFDWLVTIFRFVTEFLPKDVAWTWYLLHFIWAIR